MALDITYLPHMKPFCPTRPQLVAVRANMDQLLALLPKCVKVLACFVVGRAFCFVVYVVAVGISDGADKCRRMVFGISTIPNDGLCQEYAPSWTRLMCGSRE